MKPTKKLRHKLFNSLVEKYINMRNYLAIIPFVHMSSVCRTNELVWLFFGYIIRNTLLKRILLHMRGLWKHHVRDS